ncbi:MAG: CBS domain-containing protein [Candidatus Xenobia bacterium]
MFPSPATSVPFWDVRRLMVDLSARLWTRREVITIGPDEPITAAAHKMLEHGIGALPVVEGGRLVGMVTEKDVLRLVSSS